MYSCKMLILQKRRKKNNKNSPPVNFSLYITVQKGKKNVSFKWKIFFFLKNDCMHFHDFLKDKGGVSVSWAKSLCRILEKLVLI